MPLDAALFYAEQGRRIFPCYLDEDEDPPRKKPHVKWTFAPSNDPNQIVDWWEKWPDALIGHVPGSSDCVVFDIDIKDGSPGKLNWNKLGVDSNDTAKVQTRSGGWHVWFQRGDAGLVGNNDLCPGVNVRCDKGYVMLPSPGSGYKWVNMAEPQPMPQKLAELLRSVQNKDHRTAAEASSEEWKLTGALNRWRDRIERRWWRSDKKEAWVAYLTMTVQDVIPKNKLHHENRSDIVWAMENDFRELGIPQGDAFEIIWPMAVCKWQGRRNGERDLRIEIAKAYGGNEGEQGGQKADPFIRLSDVVRKEVTYLWKPYFPHSLATIIEGHRRRGKSYVLQWLMATTSVGGRTPDGQVIERGECLYISRENPASFILGGRIEAMGGDMTKIHCLDENDRTNLMFDEEGLKTIENKVLAIRPKLIGVDPINSFVPGGVNLGAANQVRPLIEKVVDIAAKVGAALVIVRQWRKASGSAVNMGAGIADIGAAARSVLSVTWDKDDNKIRYMAHVDATMAEVGPTRQFHLEGDPDAHLVWDGTSDLTAEDLADGVQKSPRDEAKEFLADFLKDGPKLADDVKTAAEAHGHMGHTLRRAREDLGVMVGKEKGVQRGRWTWGLPG